VFSQDDLRQPDNIKSSFKDNIKYLDDKSYTNSDQVKKEDMAEPFAEPSQFYKQ